MITAILAIVPLFIGTTELLLIGGLALLLFGGKKLPEMMKGLGQGVKSFKQGMNEPATEQTPESPAAETAVNKEEVDSENKTDVGKQ